MCPLYCVQCIISNITIGHNIFPPPAFLKVLFYTKVKVKQLRRPLLDITTNLYFPRTVRKILYLRRQKCRRVKFFADHIIILLILYATISLKNTYITTRFI